MNGYCDLHNHLLYGLDDGARTLDDSLEMARALVDLGFDTVAPSPHARPEYAPAPVALERLREVQEALARGGIPLSLHPNAENFFLDEALVPNAGSPSARALGQGRYLLVEAPYRSPVPALQEIVFRLKLKGVTALIAHPERCLEFERKGRAEELVQVGARLQLDMAALLGRYGPLPRKLAHTFLDAGLYCVAATDMHAPAGVREWVGKAMKELQAQVGARAAAALLRDNPHRILRGESLEM